VGLCGLLAPRGLLRTGDALSAGGDLCVSAMSHSIDATLWPQHCVLGARQFAGLLDQRTYAAITPSTNKQYSTITPLPDDAPCVSLIGGTLSPRACPINAALPPSVLLRGMVGSDVAQSEGVVVDADKL
jgi:hypothetical protein